MDAYVKGTSTNARFAVSFLPSRMLSVCMSASHPKATALTILPVASCQGFRVLGSLGIVADAPSLELSLPTSREW